VTTVQQATPSAVTTANRLPEEGRKRRPRRKNGPGFWIAMVVLTVVILAPLVYMLLTSVKSVDEARSVPPTVFPGEPTLRAFQVLFFGDEASPVLRWLLNSVIAATAHSLLVVVICSMAGYALARMEFPFKKTIFGLIIATLFLPAFIFMMPNFEILNRLGWLDTLWAIIVPGAAGAFGVFFMRQFFSTIPMAPGQ
jgi:multiple sugar transport system permease protein